MLTTGSLLVRYPMGALLTALILSSWIFFSSGVRSLGNNYNLTILFTTFLCLSLVGHKFYYRGHTHIKISYLLSLELGVIGFLFLLLLVGSEITISVTGWGSIFGPLGLSHWDDMLVQEGILGTSFKPLRVHSSSNMMTARGCAHSPLIL